MQLQKDHGRAFPEHILRRQGQFLVEAFFAKGLLWPATNPLVLVWPLRLLPSKQAAPVQVIKVYGKCGGQR